VPALAKKGKWSLNAGGLKGWSTSVKAVVNKNFKMNTGLSFFDTSWGKGKRRFCDGREGPGRHKRIKEVAPYGRNSVMS